jgi:dipeptidyl aminopeptidase/acylaminoacyl peptidase
MVTGYGGTRDDDPDYYQAIAPLTCADRIKTPVLLIHGMADMVAPPEHSQWMYEALRKSGNVRVRLELLPGRGHFFEEGGDGYRVDAVVRLTIDWFDQTLKRPRFTVCQ